MSIYLQIAFILLSFFPSVFVVAYVYKHDKLDKEPIILLILLFIGGILAAAIAAKTGLSRKVETFWVQTFFYGGDGLGDVAKKAIYCFLGVGIAEEFLKYLFIFPLVWFNKAFNHFYDGILYCVCVGTGFAFRENIGYFTIYYRLGQFDKWLFVARLLACSAHVLFAVIMGYYLSKAKECQRKSILVKRSIKKILLFIVLSYVVPVIIHGAWDFACELRGIPEMARLGLIIAQILAVLASIVFTLVIPFQSANDRRIKW